jgi:sugar phosphate isomerase/epimerase
MQMQRALSTYCFVNHRLTTAWLDRIWDAGIPLIEIFCSRKHLDYRDSAQVSDVAAWFRDSQLKVHSLHSPVYSDDEGGWSGPQSRINITEPVKSKRIVMVDEIKRALDMVEAFPFRYLIQHIGAKEEEYSEQKLDAAFTALEEIVLFAKQRGVEVLLENLNNRLACAERLLHFNDITHLNLNFCFDTGHAHVTEGVANSFGMMKDRIKSTHIHDNDGKEDLHLYPQDGTIDWREAMTVLRSRSAQYPLMLELKERADLPPNSLDAIQRVFDALENVRSLEPEEV